MIRVGPGGPPSGVRIEEEVAVEGIRTDARVLDLWYPVIGDDPVQQVLDFSVGSEHNLDEGHDAEHGNRVLHLRLHRPLPSRILIHVNYLVERVPAQDAGCDDQLESWRGLLESADPNAARAELLSACDSAGLPVRAVAGHRLRRSHLEPHSWTEVFVSRLGWVVADPSCRRLGGLGPDHLTRSRGSDILLQPVQRGPRLPSFAAPYAELDGRPHPVSMEATAAPAAQPRLPETALLREIAGDAGLRNLWPRPRRLVLRKGATLSQGDPAAEWLYVLEAGALRLARLNTSGRKLDLEAVTAPGFLLGARVARGLAEAVEESVVRPLSRDHVSQLASRHPTFALELLDTIGRRLVSSEDRLEYLAYHGVPARLALVLLRLRGADDGVLHDVTHQDLADMVGAHRETVTKVLRGFQAAGTVQLAHRRIRVCKPAALSELLEG
jgi:CRP-like cAMP-binding protein